MAVLNFQDLIAWQRAMEFVGAVYRLTRSFPREELYGLTNQLRRASVSIPSNIAEGQGRGAGDDFCRFLRYAIGSLQEARTQLLLSEQLGFVSREELNEFLCLCDETARLTKGLLASVLPTTNH